LPRHRLGVISLVDGALTRIAQRVAQLGMLKHFAQPCR
jgi:hypothetical protein